ncbi:MAG: DUF4760 domain-containing protein [Ramlibacter sp.]|nr:DUF4760 domain-containing protein [Ramlibacter sp.]
MNAIVTIRNSVKQHTVNTLLQSRLSQLYMQKVGEVNAALAPPGQPYRRLAAEQISATESVAVVDGVRYFLNYFEFVAVGVRHGDLDEDLMKGSLRGIVSRLSDAGHELIRVESGETSGKPNKTYEHLKWLNRRWADGARHASMEFWFVLLAYGLVASAATYYAGPILDALTATPAKSATAAAAARQPSATASSSPVKPAK